jgi:hypothetical protein
MGRWWNYWRNKGHCTKKRVESYQYLDCSWCYDKGNIPLVEGAEIAFCGCKLTFSSSYILASPPYEYTHCRYKIPVVATECNYGSKRHWFLCPLPTCHRRRKKLYFHPLGFFACRKCLKLAYVSQNRNSLDRIIDKKWHLIRKLGGDSDIIAQKPKRMHCETFNRIQEEIWRLNELAERRIFEQFCNPFNLL